MGWNTFAVGLSQGVDDPYPRLRQYVVSGTHQPSEVGGEVCLVADDPLELVWRLKAEPSFRGIWLCGGGALAGALRSEIDRLVLKVNPVLLGSGIPVFQAAPSSAKAFSLESSRTFQSGVLMATYAAARHADGPLPAKV